MRIAGRAGYVARGVVFLIAGTFVANAGLEARASKAGGIEQALNWLQAPWDLVVALGHVVLRHLCIGVLSASGRAGSPGPAVGSFVVDSLSRRS